MVLPRLSPGRGVASGPGLSAGRRKRAWVFSRAFPHLVAHMSRLRVGTELAEPSEVRYTRSEEAEVIVSMIRLPTC